MSHHDLPSLPGVDDWVRACDLSKRGSEWCGPCPLCGGKDRFHVRDADGCALVGCRGCIDGRLQEDRRRQYSKLLREVFGDAGGLVTANAFTSRRRSSETRSRTNAARADLASSVARRIWDAGIKADGTPAHRYLVGRMVWPPNGVGPGLPASVRWLARDAAPAAVPGTKWFELPPACAGAILYAFVGADSRIRSVSLDALDADGARMEERWRRTFGRKVGRCSPCRPSVSRRAYSCFAKARFRRWLPRGCILAPAVSRRAARPAWRTCVSRDVNTSPLELRSSPTAAYPAKTRPGRPAIGLRLPAMWCTSNGDRTATWRMT